MWQWKTGALFLTACLVASPPALSETSREAAEVAAARQARTCYVEMMDGQLKCGGRPRRSLADARALLGPGTLAKPNESHTCNAGKPVWLFKWRGFPNQAPIVNVVAATLIVFSVIPVWLAQRLSGDAESLGAGR